MYWIVNLVGRCVEVYADPAGNDYRNPEVFGEMDEVPFDLAARELSRIPVRELLP